MVPEEWWRGNSSQSPHFRSYRGRVRGKMVTVTKFPRGLSNGPRGVVARKFEPVTTFPLISWSGPRKNGDSHEVSARSLEWSPRSGGAEIRASHHISAHIVVGSAEKW